MIFLFQNILFLKIFLHAVAILGYLPKSKRGLVLALGAHSLHDFFYKNVPYLIIYQWTKFQCHIFFSSQDIKQNVLLSSYLDV